MKHEEWRKDGCLVSTDPDRLDLDVIHGFLTTSYWAAGIPRAVVERSLRHSLRFGLYDDARQVGLARVISDRATFAYLADVFVLESHRGRGLGKWLIECVRTHPDLQGLRLWALLTRDAHGLYRSVGFAPLGRPERWMEIRDPEVYRRSGPFSSGRSVTADPSAETSHAATSRGRPSSSGRP